MFNYLNLYLFNYKIFFNKNYYKYYKNKYLNFNNKNKKLLNFIFLLNK